MPRPKCERKVCGKPGSDYFKPRGIPLFNLEEVVLTPDEMEAIRLADLEGMYQEHAAENMGISRQTFGRIIESAHKKVAEALIKGKALRIEGGKAFPDSKDAKRIAREGKNTQLLQNGGQ